MKNREIKKEEKEAMTSPPPVATPTVKSTGMVTGIIIGVLLCTTIVLGYVVIKNTKTEEKPVSTVPIETPVVITREPVQELTPTAYLSPTPLVLEKKDFGVVNWIQFPKVLEKMDIFNQESVSNGWLLETAKFHQVGGFSDGSKLINLYIDQDGMGVHTNLIRLVASSTNEIYVLNVKDEWLRDLFNTQKVRFVATEIEGLVIPEKIETNKGKLMSYLPFMSEIISYTQLENTVFFEKSEYGDIYVIYSKVEDKELGGKLKDKLFYLRLKDDTVAAYKMKPGFLSDDSVPKIVWKGTNLLNRDQFVAGIAMGGCGSRAGEIVDAGLLDNKSEIGTAEGVSVYQVLDTNNLINKKLYDQAYFGQERKLSPEELINTRNYFLWQDGMGDWTIYVSNKFVLPAECGKPVIYLYPENETVVDVQVGAEIRKSEPIYPGNGWTVLAKPDGELIYQGQRYPYLFWEGLGEGVYPNYQDQGTVVKQENLVETVKGQLKQLGLNEKETADFMEFWQERLPKTPYVRLTWLTTEDMDKLAPLAVRPRPESYIRVFLEFEGLEKPKRLIPQKLTAPERKGFTLVEWGGLLIKQL